MRCIKYQQVLIVVDEAGAAIEINVNSDKLYAQITGIALELPYNSNYFQSRLQLSIAGEELFPSLFEAKRICSSQDVAPDDRFYTGTKENPLQDEAKGSLVTGLFTDGGLDTDVTYPYVAVLYLRLENVAGSDKQE